ncbi:MAG: acylphosphatase [Nitrospirota bacterium]
MENARAHLFIEGRVQGVFYRSFTRDFAQRLGLNGWVKNLRDGRVEALFEGAKDIIEKAVAACYAGPPASRVSHIDIHWEEYIGDQEGFSITY